MDSLSFKIIKTESKTRISILKTTKNLEIECPNFIYPTRRGSHNHLTPDNLELIPEIKCLSIGVGDIITKPGISTLKKYNEYILQKKNPNKQKNETEKTTTLDQPTNTNKDKETEIINKPGIASFYALKNKLIFLTLRDPFLFQMTVPSIKNSVVITSYEGSSVKISAQDYNTLITEANPDIWTNLYSEQLPMPTGKKLMKLTAKNNQWAKNFSTVPKPKQTGFFSIIEGGSEIKQRQNSISQSVDKNCEGIVIGSLFLGETACQRQEILGIINEKIQEDKPKILIGDGQITDVLEAIEAGVDLFCGFFPEFVSELKLVLNLTDLFSLENVLKGDLSKFKGEFYKEYLINICDPKFRDSLKPLVQGCNCFTCQNHKSCYLYHLANSHEMTFDVLITIHNLWQFSNFFVMIREAIKIGKFTEYKKLILDYLEENQ
ncbi:queuine tRNA-ribosyltransferase accessory subunit 2 [Anaeramoeba ignava]|uniref:Queuine tRNA-ribosyltransferase accessory subunit 2 n=1 Tax=Anaeramoeba ignava TaxID=1746090 RepID=A0A9Q0LQC3_ANAIG|nr:queuine tRNA-ribosyltransferase accessory subunit 2 [Anaeramoeba ignava]